MGKKILWRVCGDAPENLFVC
jgi:hypothetical protein